MNYMNLIANGKSVRSYKNKAVDSKLLQELKGYTNNSLRLISDIAVEAEILDNATVFEKLNGIAGYQGHMINAPHYLFLCSEQKDYYIENAGYMGEDMILKANDIGIDSCWITFEDSDKIKAALGISTDKAVVAIIALGYAAPADKTVVNATKTGDNYSKSQMDIVKTGASYRVHVEDIVFMDKWGSNATVEQMEERGILDAFQYANMAPSTLNRQPWRYIIDGGTVVFALRKDAQISEYEEKIDSGISMLFFKAVIDATLFQLKWQLGQPAKNYDIPDDYKIVATCSI